MKVASRALGLKRRRSSSKEKTKEFKMMVPFVNCRPSGESYGTQDEESGCCSVRDDVARRMSDHPEMLTVSEAWIDTLTTDKSLIRSRDHGSRGFKMNKEYEPLGASENRPDWFYPEWAADAPNNQPIVGKDTDSALGRYNLQTKEIGLKDIARIHGHMCDGLVIAFVEIKAVLGKVFPDGVVDRTDLQVVSKNGPCWADAAAFLTGARINFKTLRIDASIAGGFIIQRISTGEAYHVHLKPGVFPDDQVVLENRIRSLRAQGNPVTAEDIDTVEKMGDSLSLKLLTAPPEELLEITRLNDYKFNFTDMFGDRGDIINKDMPR